MIVGMKLIPIAIMHYKRYPFNPIHDLFVLFIVFGVYNFYLYTRGTDMHEVYSKIEKSMVKGENKTPVFMLLEKIRSYF
jgi:hypothetical protein